MKTNFFKNKKDVFFFIALLCAGVVILLTNGQSGKTADTDRSERIEQYRKAAESRLESIISEMNGISRVKVFVEFEEYSASSGQNAIYVSKDDQGDKLPKIKGVAVVCDRGNEPEIKAEITKLICAACGLYSTRVYVSG